MYNTIFAKFRDLFIYIFCSYTQYTYINMHNKCRLRDCSSKEVNFWTVPSERGHKDQEVRICTTEKDFSIALQNCFCLWVYPTSTPVSLAKYCRQSAWLVFPSTNTLSWNCEIYRFWWFFLFQNFLKNVGTADFYSYHNLYM